MDRLKECRVQTVAAISDSQSANIWMTFLQLVLWGRLARQINWREQNLAAHVITMYIHLVPGHSGIPGNEYPTCQANVTRQASSSTVIVWPYTSASNTARHSAERWSAARAIWEADKWSKPCSYRDKGRQKPRDLFGWQAWTRWRPGSTDCSSGMHPLESTRNGSATKRTTNAGGAVADIGQWPRCGNTSSATAALEETSKRHYVRRWDRQWAVKRPDAHTCWALICFP